MHEQSFKRDGNKTILCAPSALAMAVVFSLIFYGCNSPLGPAVGSDNAMYLTMGTALTKGYAPYSDIFDHKGPLLFVLQAIPQLFTQGYSTLAVFVQEVLFLWACLLMLARIARRSGAGALPVQLIYLALIAPNCDGGNLSELYTNLFTLTGIDLMLGAFEGEIGEAKAMRKPAFGMGALAMICFLTRANNALPLAAAVGALALWLIGSKRFAHLGACVSGFLLGCAAALLPVVVWLCAHGALSDAFYGAIIHNMKYAATQGNSRIYMLLYRTYGHRAIFMAVLSCLGGLAVLIRTRRLALPMAMVFGAAGGGLAAFISHKFYMHYLLLSAPLAAFGAAQLLSSVKSARRSKGVYMLCTAVCMLTMCIHGHEANMLRETDYAAMQALTPDAQALYAQVPEEDRDRFMAYRVEPKWYVATGALPCMRFYFLQEILADADPAVMDEIVEEFHADPPRWVVLFYNRPFSPPYDARVQEIFDTCYEFVDAKGQYQLLRLRDEAL